MTAKRLSFACACLLAVVLASGCGDDGKAAEKQARQAEEASGAVVGTRDNSAKGNQPAANQKAKP